MEELKKALQDDDIVPIKEATKREGEYTPPFPIGYSIIDEAFKGGVREGDLIIGTGLSGGGKTTLFQNISVNLSKAGEACTWFSYEVIIDNLYAKFKDMGIGDDSLKVFVPRQMTTGNLEWVQEKIKESIDKYNTKFIFIDHLDFLAPKKTIKSSDQKRMIIRDICSELKTMAISLRVVVFLISHVKKVQGRAIEMQDLSESSAIYQLADAVLAVQRCTTTEVRSGQKIEVPTRNSILRVLKNRITGEQPVMDFYLENNIIVPIGLDPIEEDELVIEVVPEEEEKPQKLFFGMKD